MKKTIQLFYTGEIDRALLDYMSKLESNGYHIQTVPSDSVVLWLGSYEVKGVKSVINFMEHLLFIGENKS